MIPWRTAKRLLTLVDEINTLYPGRNKSADGTIGDTAHSKVKSEHNPDRNGVVRALDITHDPVHGLDIEKLADRIIAERDDSLWYVIVNRNIWENGHWKPYRGIDPHTGHLHISLYDRPDLYDKTTPWLLKGEDEMVDDNFIRAFWLDLFGTEPTEQQKKQYKNKNWMVVYSELRNSPAAKQRREYLAQVEKDNQARAEGLIKAQQMIADLQVSDPTAKAKLDQIKQILEA